MADTVTVVRHGVSCASADALAKLTRPDGSSLVDGQLATHEAMQLAIQGGCTRLQIGQTFTATSIRKNTTIVTADAGDGQGIRPFYLPNIDLSIHRATQPDQPSTAAAAAAAAGNRSVHLATGLAPTGSERSPAAAPSSHVPSALTDGDPIPAPVNTAKTADYFSTAGIFLGESLTEAKLQLAKSYLFDGGSPTGGDPTRNIVLAYKKDSTDSVGFITLDDHVVYINHVRSFLSGAEPSADAVQKLVLQKYGKGSYYQIGGPEQFQMSWLFTADNMPSRGSLCGNFGGFGFDATDPQIDPSLRGPRATVGATFMTNPPSDPNCHKFILAASAGDVYAHIITRLTITLYDADPFRLHEKASQDAAAAAEKKRVGDANKKLAPL